MVLSNINLPLPIQSLSFDFFTPLVHSQDQTDSSHFYFSNSFYILPHALLLHKLNNYGLSSGHLNWFLSYVTNRQSCVRFCGIFSSPLSCFQAYLKGQTQGLCFLKKPFINLIKIRPAVLSLKPMDGETDMTFHTYIHTYEFF